MLGRARLSLLVVFGSLGLVASCAEPAPPSLPPPPTVQGDSPTNGPEPSVVPPTPDDVPASNEPTGEEPASEEPTGEEPASEEPTGEEPANEEPTGEEPASDDPPAEDSADSETATDESLIAAPLELEATTEVKVTPFGMTADGQQAMLYEYVAPSGVVLAATNYGATLVRLEVPDRDGKLANVCLGFDSVTGYEEHTSFFGCTTGRFANRIALGKFTLDGQEYTLATNNGPNHLHGGVRGFNRHLWHGEPVQGHGGVGVRFTRRSPDGEEGYPGNLDVSVTYLLFHDHLMKNSKEILLNIIYEAQTDAPTVLNLTNHTYWNLAGQGDIRGHVAEIFAERYVAVDAQLIPTGELASVEGTPLDFRTPTPIGERLDDVEIAADVPRGYDHCYVLTGETHWPKHAAHVTDPGSGREINVVTTEPGVQLYTGNFLDGSAGSGGHAQYAAFCLETQHYPDSPNQPTFPTTVLRPGETFRSQTGYFFLRP